MAAILSVNCQTILFGLCIGLLVYYVTRRLKYRLPPGPWCVPVIGNVQGKYTPVNSGESGQSISIQQYTVIDCGFGQQIRLRVKKTAVVRETSLYQFVIHLHFFKIARKKTDPYEGQTKLLLSKKPVYQSITVLLFTFIFSLKNYSFFPLTYLGTYVFNINVRRVRESKRYCDVNMTSLSHDLLNQ